MLIGRTIANIAPSFFLTIKSAFIAKMAALALATWLGNTQSRSPRRKFLRGARNCSEENPQIRETVQMTFENVTLSLLAPEREREEREGGYFCVAGDESGRPARIRPCSAAKPVAFCCICAASLAHFGRWFLN